MRSTRRTIRELAVIGLVLTLVVGIIVSAVRADGQRIIRPDTNDGGAWLIKRDEGVVGHVNRSSREVTGVVRLAARGDLIDTEQSGQTVVVVNDTTNVLDVVDARTFQSSNRIDIPDDLQVRLTADEAVMWTDAPLSVWRVSLEVLGQIRSLDEIDPIIVDEGTGLVEVTRFGSVLTVANGSGQLQRFAPGTEATAPLDLGALGPDIVGLTAAGDAAVLLTRAGALFVVEHDDDELGEPVSFGNVAAIGQPSLPDQPIVAISDDGSILTVEPNGSTGSMAVSSGSVSGSNPLPPVVHRGCVFAVTASPPELTRSCNGQTEAPQPLPGASGNSLRLRLINNWVWVNDLRTGAMWVINEDAPLDRIDDWGAALGDNSDAGDESNEVEDGKIEQRENPDADDAELIRADEIDEDGINEPPVARDDTATTRVDLPLVIDVLRNDEDPDGDVILVTEIEAIPEATLIDATGDRRAIQVTPKAGFVGELSFSYTISDGRGGTASATVRLDVVDPTTHTNRPPVAVTDVATALAGSSAALNVLDNDSDPDGDSLVLLDVTAPSGSVSFDGSGQVTYRPDPASAEGTIQLDYEISDTLGLTATGTIRVAIRLPGSNNPPDARNDSAITVAGNPVSFNVLLNDTDPDGDAISVTNLPTLISGPQPSDPASLSPDGQMFFLSDEPGEYLYTYTVTDGPDSDTAVIRIDVSPEVDNRPPVAVRDDITIARGGSATAYVLANDSDPDGDVVSILGWQDHEFATIESFRGVGFIISVAPNAPEQFQFRYTITDGQADASPGIVVVAVADTTGVNQSPVVAPDVIEVRPGSTTSVRVLLNDFDPEGSALRVGQVSAVDGVDLRVGPGGQEILVTVDDDVINGFTFAYDALDDAGNRSGTFVDVRIVPDDGTNRPPTARADTGRTRERTPVVIPVLDNDSDPDGDLIRIESIAAQPTAGTASIEADGTIRYTPDAGFRGTDRFRYVLIDQFGDRAIGNVLVGVIPETEENRAPTALDDAFTVVAGSDTVALPVVANDFDPDGDTLRITRTTVADSIETTDDKQSIRFTPPVAIEAESVTVTIRYSIDDGRGGTANAIVTVTVVQAVDPEPPVPLDDTVGPVKPGAIVTVPVLENDIDPDGRRDDLVIRSDDSLGTPDQLAGTLTFTAGTEASTHPYTVTDADGLSGQARVVVLVEENVAPELTPLVEETPYEEPILLSLAAQAIDADGDALFYVCCDQVRGGSTTIAASGPGEFDILYTPDPGFFGQAGFSYSVDDKNGHEVSGSVVVNVLPKENTAPTATSIVADIEAGTTGTIDLSASADDIDIPTGDAVTFSISNASGSDISASGPIVTITPPIDAGGTTRSFDFTVTDRDGATASASATIAITESLRPPPLAVDDIANTTQAVSVTIDVVANDLDELGAGLRVIAAGSTTPVGTITTDAAAGTVTFDPEISFFGTARISYTIEDARRSAGGQATGQITVDVVGFPGVPPTPQAVADNATATITWGQPEANGGPITQFELESDQGQSVTLPPSSSHTFNGLQNGVEHTFRIRAENEAGWGEWSAWSTPVRPDIEPSRPGAPTVTFDDEALLVEWVEPPNDGSPVDGYILEIGGGESGNVTLGPLTSYRWSNLTNGTSYQFRVIATNLAGNSDVSAWSTTEHPLREPDAADPLIATRGDQYLDLAWTRPVLNGDPVIEYQLEMQSDPGTYVSTTSRSYRWADLPNGDEQSYRLRSRNRDVDWSDWSGWSIPQKPCGVPLAPGSSNATRGDTLANVTWTIPDDNGCVLSSFTIEAVGTGLTQTATAGATTHQFTGLPNGVPVSFRIRANNEEGAGAWSANTPTVTPAGPPARITNLTMTPVATSGHMRYQMAGPNPNGDPISRIELRVNGGGTETANITNGVGSASPSGLRTGLAENTQYTFEVRACNSVGCATQWSNAATGTTFGPPSTPSGLVGSGGDLWVQWNWNSVSSPTPGLYYDIAEVPYDTVPFSARSVGTNTSYRNSSYVTPYGRHSARVRACNDLGCSPYSGSVNATAIPAAGSYIARTGVPPNRPDCNTAACSWISLNLTGLQPNTTYTTTCYDLTAGAPFSTIAVTTNSSGNYSDSTRCYFGFPGRQVQILVLGNDSNIINW